SLARSHGPEEPIRPDDIERQLRGAVRDAEKGDVVRATRKLDQILTLQPLNREALAARAYLALGESQRATAPPDQAAALEKALELVRTLHRAYDRPKPGEGALYGDVLYTQARMLVGQGHVDRALAVLKEAYDNKYDPFDRIETDEAMKSLRAAPQYHALVKAIDAANLAQARQRVQGRLDRPLDLAFDFTLPDLDGKPFALASLRGKVVLIDFWGTWCKPCQESIPHLV